MPILKDLAKSFTDAKVASKMRVVGWELSLRGTILAAIGDDISRFKFRCDCWESQNPQKMTLQEVFS